MPQCLCFENSDMIGCLSMNQALCAGISAHADPCRGLVDAQSGWSITLLRATAKIKSLCNWTLPMRIPNKLTLIIYVILSLLLYFWLCWVFIANGHFPSCGEQGLLSSSCSGFSSRWLCYLWSVGSRAHGLQKFQLLRSRAQVGYLRHRSSVAPENVASSWARGSY